jgi:hypothetical protein
MKPERRDSSLLGNGGKQVPAEMHTHAAIKEPPSVFNGELNTPLQQQKNC